MPLPTAGEMHKRYEALRDEFLPLSHYQKCVAAEDQEREIQLLKETIRFERFFFVMDLHGLKIRHTHGLERWLGYADQSFTLMDFLDVIHPAHVAAHHLSAIGLLEGLLRGDWPVEFMKHRYNNLIALRHRNGHYLCFKRLACVFQYNEKHQLMEYVNEFTLVSDYKGQPYSVGALNEDGSPLVWLDEVLKRIRLLFQNKNLFSFQELRILRKYAYKPQLSSAQIAEAFKIEGSTLITHKKRIQNKAEGLFQKRFENIWQVAAALKEQGMI